MSLRTAILSLLLTGALFAQTATYKWVKSSSCASPWSSLVQVIGLPKLGTSFQIQMGPSFSPVVSSFLVTGIPLQKPIDFRTMGPRSCGFLHVLPLVLTVAPQSSSLQSVRVTFQVPKDKSLLGLKFVQQGLALWFSGQWDLWNNVGHAVIGT